MRAPSRHASPKPEGEPPVTQPPAIQLPGLPLPGRPQTLITIIVTLSDDPAITELQKNRDTRTQYMPGGQVPQRHRQRPGPVHLKGHLITHRDSVEHVKPLTPQHTTPTLGRLKNGRQIPHRPAGDEDVGVLTLHNVLMKEPGQFLPDSATSNSLVITNRRLHKWMSLQTSHTHQPRPNPHHQDHTSSSHLTPPGPRTLPNSENTPRSHPPGQRRHPMFLPVPLASRT